MGSATSFLLASNRDGLQARTKARLTQMDVLVDELLSVPSRGILLETGVEGDISSSDFKSIWGNNENYQYVAQGFKLLSAQSIGSIGVYLSKTGAPAQTLTIYILGDNGGEPNLLDIKATSNTKNEANIIETLPDDWGLYNFTFPTPFTGISNTQYYMAITKDAETEANFTSIGYDPDNPYSNGKMWTYDETSLIWTSYAGSDIVMIIGGAGSNTDTYLFLSKNPAQKISMAIITAAKLVANWR